MSERAEIREGVFDSKTEPETKMYGPTAEATHCSESRYIGRPSVCDDHGDLFGIDLNPTLAVRHLDEASDGFTGVRT